MPEIRQNIATKEWVIIATERAQRPEDFAPPPRPTAPLAYDPHCPFCPGNESQTTEEQASIRDEQGHWLVRAVLNKYAALSRQGELHLHEQGCFRSISGVGLHDVIVETRGHDQSLALQSVEQIERVLWIWGERYLVAVADPRVELVTLFKNHGPSAGMSLAHPHSQMIASPVVPAHIRDRVAQAMVFYDDHRQCVFCRMLAEERAAGLRLVHETPHFVTFLLYAALSPFHMWIMPKRHVSSFPELIEEELRDLAGMLKTVLGKLYTGLGDPDYNLVVRSLPGTPRPNSFFHCYLSLIPRISKTAGFELGSGMYVNTTLPEDAAQFLRGIPGPPSAGS